MNEPATLSMSNAFNPVYVDAMVERAVNVLANVKDKAAVETYLADLFQTRTIDDLKCEFLTTVVYEPELTSEELTALAERVVAYHDGDIHLAKYAVRNIINSVPASIDDLIDYTTEHRKREFVANMCNLVPHLIGKQDEIKTLQDLQEALSDTNQLLIDFACNEEMSRFQSIPLTDVDGETPRQKMLFMAANYYLNHSISFNCNSVWLACFTHNNVFGCTSGWIHQDGTLCNHRHFGFKDPAGSADIILENLDYIEEFIDTYREKAEGQPEGSHPMQSTLTLYKDAVVAAIQYYTKLAIEGSKDVGANIKVVRLNNILLSNLDLLEDGDKIILSLSYNALTKSDIDDSQTDMIYSLIQATTNEPEKFYMDIFDAWNFFVFSNVHKVPYDLFNTFAKTRYVGSAITQFAGFANLILRDNSVGKNGKAMFEGFYTGYLWALINENSKDHYMFDDIFQALVNANDDIHVETVIRAMAEMNHEKAVQYLVDTTTGNERTFWEKRLARFHSETA